MPTKLLLLFSLVLAFSACKKTPVVEPDRPSPINLSDLNVGQQSTYIKYTATCENMTSDLSYTTDSLVLSVIEENDNLYFEERLSDHSPMLEQGVPQTNTHIVYANNKTLIIPNRFDSQLFYFFGNDTLPVIKPANIELSQVACKLQDIDLPFMGNDIGEVNQFDFGGYTHNDVRAISCEPFFSLQAYLIYDNQTLYRSHTITESFFGGQVTEHIEGWVLLEE